MSLRLKRLTTEHQRLIAAYDSHGRVRIRPDSADPPERYEVDYFVKGLERLATGELVSRNEHTIEIVLPSDYPRLPPVCKMKTPVFHPNIDVWTICTSDHWAAQETLVDLVVRIGQIITFQSYNTKSPLNADAARWCDENLSRLPVDPTDLHPPDVEATRHAIGEGVATCERLIGELSQCREVKAAAEALQNAERVLAGLAETPKEATDLAKSRAVAASTLEALTASFKELSNWFEVNAPWLQAREIIGSLLEGSRRAGELLKRLESLSAPAWMTNGGLDRNQVKEYHDEVAAVAEGLRHSLSRAKQAAGLAINSIPTLSVESYPPALRSIAAHGRETSNSISKNELIDAFQRGKLSLRALSTLAQSLEMLYKSLVTYHRGRSAALRAQEIRSSVEAPCDAVEVNVNGIQSIIPVGHQQECTDGVGIRCRVSLSSGHLALSDERGRKLVEIRDDAPARFSILASTGSARNAGLNSHHTRNELNELILQLPEEISVPRLAEIEGYEAPAWWKTFHEQKTPVECAALKAEMIQLRDLFAFRWWVAKQRTATMDLQMHLDAGNSWYKRAFDITQMITSLKDQMAAIGGRGQQVDRGVVELRPREYDRYERLYSEYEAMKGVAAPALQAIEKASHQCERLIDILTRGMAEQLNEIASSEIKLTTSALLANAHSNVDLWRKILEGAA